MPYTMSSLPANVKKLGAKQQRQWMHIFNSCAADGKPDSKCFAMANGVVKGGKDLTDEETVAVVEAKDYQFLDSWDVQDRQLNQQAANYDPLGATATEGCANCQWFIAPSRCVVVSGTISPTGHSDQWMAQVPNAPAPMLVQLVDADGDPMDMGDMMGGMDMASKDTEIDADGGDELIELADDELEIEATLVSLTTDAKATLSTAARNKLPKSSCGWVDDNGKCHFPLNDAAHVRNAAARFPGKTPANKRAGLKAKIIAAAKRFKVDVPSLTGEKDAAMADRSSWVERTLSAVKSALVGISDVPTGPGPLPVLAEGRPFSLLKTKDGRLRFFTAWSNNFVDREGEVFPEYAHKEFIEWADTNQQYPELWQWHTKGTRYGQVDWLDYTDGFVFASGLIDVGCEALAEQISKEDSGVSHGFAGIQRGKEIVQYRSWEISTLPRTNAAVWTTSFDIIGQGAKEMAFTQQKKDYLKAHGLTDEQIAAAEKQATNLSASLKSLGVAFKDADIVEDPPQSSEASGATGAAPSGAAAGTPQTGMSNNASEGEKAATQFQQEMLAALQKNTEALAALAGSVKAIDDRVKAVEKTDDDKIAAAMTSRAAGTAGSAVQASKSAANIVDEQQTGTDKVWFETQFLGALGVGPSAGAAAAAS